MAKVNCPKCRQLVNVPRKQADQKIRCKLCGTRFAPESASGQAAPQQAAADQPGAAAPQAASVAQPTQPAATTPVPSGPAAGPSDPAAFHRMATFTVLGGGGLFIAGLMVMLIMAFAARNPGRAVAAGPGESKVSGNKAADRARAEAEKRRIDFQKKVEEQKKRAAENRRKNQTGRGDANQAQTGNQNQQANSGPGTNRGGNNNNTLPDRQPPANPFDRASQPQNPFAENDNELTDAQKRALERIDSMNVPDQVKERMREQMMRSFGGSRRRPPFGGRGGRPGGFGPGARPGTGAQPGTGAASNTNNSANNTNTASNTGNNATDTATNSGDTDTTNSNNNVAANNPTPGRDSNRPSLPPPSNNNNNQETQDEIPWEAVVDSSSLSLDFKRKISIDLPDSFAIAYPMRMSPFVLIAGEEDGEEMMHVYSLTTGGPIGQSIKGKLPNKDRGVFSPDGRYFAAPTQEGDDTLIGVYSFITGEQAQLLYVGGRMSDLRIKFAADHRLVAVTSEDWSYFMYVFDLQTGDQLHRFQLRNDDRGKLTGFTMSPGGRYCAYAMDAELKIMDLQDARSVGETQFPAKPNRLYGLAYSPDGSQIAALFDTFSGAHLVIWDAANGDKKVDRPYNGRLQHFFYDGQPLEWTPNGKTLMVSGHILIDAKTGGEVWNFPKTDSTPRRMTFPDRLLVTMREGRGMALQSADLPSSEITKALAAVSSGGDAIDSKLPPIVSANLFAAAQVPVPQSLVNWKYEPEGIIVDVPSVSREIPIGDAGSVLHEVVMAGDNESHVVVRREGAPQGAGGRANRGFLIESYELATGEPSKSLPIPSMFRLLDASPSASLALTAKQEGTDQYDRLDVLSIGDRKHFCGFRPYEGEAEHKTVLWAMFINEDTILTANGGGKLVSWSIPDCKGRFVCDGFGVPLAISPTRRYIAGQQGGRLRILDVQNGDFVGDLEPAENVENVLRGAFNDDGTEFAAVVGSGADAAMVVWNLEDGKIATQFPLPRILFGFKGAPKGFFSYVSKNLVWRGQYVLLDNRYLIDVENQAAVWEYVMPDGKMALRGYGPRQWYFAPTGVGLTKSYGMKWVDLPSNSVRQDTGGITLASQLVLSPGMKIKLNLQLGPASSERAAIEEGITKYFAARDITISNDASLTLSMTTRQTSTGEKLRASSTFGGGADREIDQKRLEFEAKLTDSSGKTVWNTRGGVSMRSFGLISDADNAERELRQEMESGFKSVLANAIQNSMPTYIFREESQLLGGRSALTIQGEGPYTPPKPNTSSSGGSRGFRPGGGGRFGSPFGGAPFGPRF